jgi:hypothetical protein
VDGAWLVPGKTVVVKLDVAPSTFSFVHVAGNGPFADSLFDLREAPPYEFKYAIPADCAAGAYTIIAIGMTLQGERLYEDIKVRIERTDSPKLLKPELTYVEFDKVGKSERLRVSGLFSDGSKIDVTDSKHLIIKSDHPNIVGIVKDVDNSENIKAVGPGEAHLTIQYGAATATVLVIVRR